jgi:hypothetical protein
MLASRRFRRTYGSEGKKALPIGISNDSSGGVLVQDCEDCLVFLGVELEVNAVGRNFRLILAEGGHAS